MSEAAAASDVVGPAGSFDTAIFKEALSALGHHHFGCGPPTSSPPRSASRPLRLPTDGPPLRWGPQEDQLHDVVSLHCPDGAARGENTNPSSDSDPDSSIRPSDETHPLHPFPCPLHPSAHSNTTTYHVPLSRQLSLTSPAPPADPVPRLVLLAGSAPRLVCVTPRPEVCDRTGSTSRSAAATSCRQAPGALEPSRPSPSGR